MNTYEQYDMRIACIMSRIEALGTEVYVKVIDIRTNSNGLNPGCWPIKYIFSCFLHYVYAMVGKTAGK